MASLTKGQLINELVNHGVKPPPTSAKKEKLVQMYQEHVSHIHEAAGEFSSDDDGAEKQVNGDEGSVSSLSTDVADLNNDELLEQLRSRGVHVGPIVGSTRRLYERKLSKLLGSGGGGTGGVEQHVATYTTRTTTVTNGGGGGGGGGEEDEYSDTEDEAMPADRLSYLPVGHSVRQRHIGDGLSVDSPTVDTSGLDPRSESLRAVFLRDWDDQPSPRRGVRDVRGSYAQEDYLFPKSVAVNRISADVADGRTGLQPAAAARTGGWLRLLVKLCVLLLLVAVGYYCYQNYSDASTFKSLQEAARAAVEKATAQMERLRQPAAGVGTAAKA